MQAKSSRSEAKTPRIWLVISDKAGDNAQVEIIAEALGTAFEIRRVYPKPEFVLGKPRFELSLDHLDLERSDPLEAPWPDLILTIGRRSAMAALWVQQQSAGHSKVVLIGKPKKYRERFSLIILPSQYQSPEDERLVRLQLPLMRHNQQALNQAAEQWRPTFQTLAKPLTAVMIGGQTKPFRLDVAVAKQLLEQLLALPEQGHLYITTSRRTSPEVVAYLQQSLPSNATLYTWSAQASENPYLGLMALADRFVVTGDSISMMVEAARTGKPVAIFALPFYSRWTAMLRNTVNAENVLGKLLAPLTRWLQRRNIIAYQRDLRNIHRMLYQKQLAVPLGQAFNRGGEQVPDELDTVTRRILQLIE